jgi:hypothetical protein
MITSLDFGNPAVLSILRTRGFPSSDYSEFGFIGLHSAIFDLGNSKRDASGKLPLRSIPFSNPVGS